MSPPLFRWSEIIEQRLRGSLLWPLILAGSTGLAALFMFLTHVVAVRVLSTSEYGEFSSAVALVGIVGVGATSVQAVTVRNVKGVVEADEVPVSATSQYLILLALAACVGGVTLIFFRVSPLTTLLLAAWVPAAVMLARANGEIQGREFQVLLHGGTTLVTLASLVLSGLFSSLSSGVGAFLFSRLAVTVIFAVFLLHSVNVSLGDGLQFFSSGLLRSTIIVTCMWFAANLDVLLGRAVLDAESVGQIATAAMLVNSVLLMPGLIASVVYPKLVASSGIRIRLVRLMVLSVAVAVILQVCFVLMLMLTSEFLIEWLAGDGHELAKEIIFPLSLAYIPLGASIVLSQALLAIGKLVDSIVFMALVFTFAFVTATRAKTAGEFVQTLHWMSWFLAIGLSLHIAVCMRRMGEKTNAV